MAELFTPTPWMSLSHPPPVTSQLSEESGSVESEETASSIPRGSVSQQHRGLVSQQHRGLGTSEGTASHIPQMAGSWGTREGVGCSKTGREQVERPCIGERGGEGGVTVGEEETVEETDEEGEACSEGGGTQFTCFTGTKIQTLTYC